MSGLASFFKTFLSSKGKEEQEESGEVANGYEYHESIASVLSDDDAAAARREAESSSSPSTPPLDPRTQSASEWRAQRNENLRVYMEWRMIAPDNSSQEEEEDNAQDKDNVQEEREDKENEHEEYVVPDNDEVHVPFWNEDMSTLTADQDSSPVSPPRSAKKAALRKNVVPHVNDTIHIAKTLSALDLYAKEFHLSLGVVEKVWPLRAIPRRQWKVSSRYEDDGPIGTLFKQVLSVEVTQLHEHHPQVATMAQAAFHQGGSGSPRRFRIFFYNKYALRISTLLKQSHLSRILISLQNIPAKCILPMDDLSQFSWFDREGLAQYCLCIGSRGSLKLEYEGVLQKVPFDSDDSKVTIACVAAAANNGQSIEVELTHKSVKGDLEPNETPSLEAAYQAWEQAQQMEKENEAPANDDEEEDEMPQRQDGADEASGSISHIRGAQTAADDQRGKKKARTEEKYHTLSELRGMFEARKGADSIKVNLFAAVLGFSSPTFTKGMDWMIKVALVDESTPLPETGDTNAEETVASTAAMIFYREKQELPKILKAGDVLRLHRVVINEWKGDLQLIGRRFSSFVVVRPQSADSTGPEDAWDIIPTARGGTHFGKSDSERSAALWQWARGRIAKYTTIHQPSSKLTLADLARPEATNVAEDKTGDMTVMVSAILPVPQALRNTGTPPGFLRVWDGTGAPTSDPLPLASAGAAEAIKKGDPPSEALMAIAKAIGEIKSVDDGDGASSLNPPECLCGRVANVAVWEEPTWDLVAETLQVGSFIRFRNVHEGRMNNGLRCLMVSSKSGLTPLPKYTFEINEMLKDHQTRILRKDPFNPQSGILPLDDDSEEIVWEEVPAPDKDAMDVDEETATTPRVQDGFASIAQCISEPAPRSFRVNFHITGTLGWAQNRGNRLQNLCIAGPGGNGYQFQFAVNVNDETAAIDAFVSNEVGEDLLQLEAADVMDISSADADAIIEEVTNEAKTWRGEIRSTEVNGSRFFVLNSVAPVHHMQQIAEVR